MNKKLFFGLIAFLLAMAVSAQDTGHRYVLRQVEFDTDRYTRESALARHVDIKEEITFASPAEMISFLDSKVQSLINTRVFNDVYYTMAVTDQYPGETGYMAVFHVKGAWTFYPIPFPKYNSNSGLRIGLKIYDYNFVGTLTQFQLSSNIDFKRENGKTRVPQWTFNPEISGIKIGPLSFSAEINQRYRTDTQFIGGAYTENYSYYSTKIGFGTSFSLPHDFSYSIGPGFTFYYGYEDHLPNNGSNIKKDVIDFGLGHTIGYGSLDWVDYFRQGWTAGLSHSIGLAKAENESVRFVTSMSGSAMYFYVWKRLNPSVRFYGSYSFNGGDSNLGDELRGVRDDELNGVAFLCLNMDLNISVIPWRGVGEAQCRPFFDVGVAWMRDRPLVPDRDIKCSAGADFILYLDFLKGLVARASLGVNLLDHGWTDGRKYEISIESSLHY